MGSDDHAPNPPEYLTEAHRFRACFDLAPDLFIIASATSGQICDLNETACNWLGQNRETLLGSSIGQWLQASEKQFDTVLKRLSEDRDGTATLVTCISGQDKSEIPVELAVHHVSLGDELLIAVTGRNITDRYSAGQALRESEARLDSILRAAPTGIGVVSDRVLVQVNERICQMTGYTADELLGRKSRMLYVNDEDFDYVGREKYRQIQATGTGTVETRWRRKDGSVIDVLLSSTPIDSDNLAIGVTFTALDITDRKRAEEALEKRVVALTRPLEANESVDFEDLFDLESIQRIQDLFAKATGVASIITAPDGTPITRPSNFCRLCSDFIRETPLGLKNCYVSDAVIGRHNPSGPIVQTCLSGGLWDAGASVSVEGRHIANWLIGQVRNEAQDEAAAIRYAQEIGADVEAYREAFREVPTMSREKFECVAETLFELASQLSTLAFQNTQQARFIADRRQAEAEKEALIAELESRNTELERFTYTVSHDLKSPLITIKGYIGMLAEDLRDGDEESVEDDIRRIAHSADTMAALLKELLDLSRVGRIVNPPTNVPIEELAQEATKSVDGLISERSVRIDIGRDLPVAYGDRQRLLEVMQNLIENAVKYMGDQEDPHIRVGAEAADGMILVYVQDNGMGIDAQYHERIFGLFDQLSGQSDGTGIGLALVKRIVEIHGGRIWVESEGAGTGSRFCFTIPRPPDREKCS